MIAIGCDHGGFALKQEVMRHLDELGLAYKDFGTYSEESCDYPIYGEAVARAVAGEEYERGILICGTGIGISISANKVKGIRAALCGDCYSAEMTRRHNDANILAMGARVLGPGLALKIVDTFLNTEFEGGRHARRIALISDIENRGGRRRTQRRCADARPSQRRLPRPAQPGQGLAGDLVDPRRADRAGSDFVLRRPEIHCL